MSFQCPECGIVSHNPNDEANHYCGRCHVFFNANGSREIPMQLTAPELEPGDFGYFEEWAGSADTEAYREL